LELVHALTLGDVLREHARSRPGQLAAVDGDVRLDYRALDARVNQLADRLAESGVERGARVCWLAQNSFRLLETLLASAKLGALCCPVNWRQSTDELAFVVEDLDPRVVFWQEAEVGEAVDAARQRSTRSARWIRHDDDGPEGYEAWRAAGSPQDVDRPVRADAPVLVVYTAAFGGTPNGAMLSHTACVSQGVVYGHFTGTTAADVYLNSGPMFHLGTLMHTLATFVAGGTNVFVPRVDATLLCEVIERERCTGAFVVGPMFEQIIAANADGRYDLSSLRTARGRPGWDAMTSPDPSPWAARPGGYGQTEAVGMMTFNCLGGDGTHGRPSPIVQLRVVDDAGHDVAPGTVGEIVARGPTIMNGYWNRRDENARRHRDGWHHTHDLGRREADGSFTFIGPKTRMIKSAAENIYPAEVERCLASHPAVAECAVIGVPDPRWVQSVKALIVVRDGATVDTDELVEHCRSRIAPYKKPRFVEFVESLPRDGYLVDYDALDDRFGGGNYPGGRTRSA
jgi:long-chain acyl-CoA synthetase